MAGAAGHPTDRLTLEAALRERPEDFELFAALRLIERARPDRARLGRSSRPGDDPVRLRQTPTLAFAPRDIDQYLPAGEGRAELSAFVLGLFGPNGPLPLHLTEYAIDRRLNAKDPTLAAFADVFHHRMLSLFYRAWADAQPVVQADRPDEDRFGFYVGALIGLTRPRAAPTRGVADTGARHFAGRLLSPARNAEGLQHLVAHAFGVTVEVLEFVPEWMRLPREAWLGLGSSDEVAGLGRTTVMGRRVRGTQQRFRLRIGPLTHAAFRAFLPGGQTLDQLATLVRGYVGDEKSWDVQLVLAAGEVPVTRLARSGRMGLDTWLGRRAWDFDDAGDVVVRPPSATARRRAAPIPIT